MEEHQTVLVSKKHLETEEQDQTHKDKCRVVPGTVPELMRSIESDYKKKKVYCICISSNPWSRKIVILHEVV